VLAPRAGLADHEMDRPEMADTADGELGTASRVAISGDRRRAADGQFGTGVCKLMEHLPLSVRESAAANVSQGARAIQQGRDR